MRSKQAVIFVGGGGDGEYSSVLCEVNPLLLLLWFVVMVVVSSVQCCMSKQVVVVVVGGGGGGSGEFNVVLCEVNTFLRTYVPLPGYYSVLFCAFAEHMYLHRYVHVYVRNVRSTYVPISGVQYSDVPCFCIVELLPLPLRSRAGPPVVW